LQKPTETLPGQTPLDPDYQKDLIPTHITLMSELNEFELENITQALKKFLFGRRKNWKIEDPEILKQIHRDMFDQTWKWAGKYRQTDTNIGSESRQIQIHVKDACGDLDYWVKNKTFAEDEISVRFHHRLIWIHPFPNGNGRHGRLVADLLMRRFGMKPFTWGGADLTSSGSNRTDYLSAMRKADQGEFGNLIRFARS
jgi:Fic-DOC domain mobile mystery protein B